MTTEDTTTANQHGEHQRVAVEWLCPDCGGGFPEPQTVTSEEPGMIGDTYEACPWCGEPIETTKPYYHDH